MLNIVVIIGSLRKESFNKKLFLALDNLFHPTLTFTMLDISQIPLYNQDDEGTLPASVADLKNAVSQADGVLFVTPEYNRSIPGVLKNVIDWGTRPYGTNCWAKPMSIIGTSQGAVGTAVGQAHLRSIMITLGAVIMGQPEMYIVFKNDLIDENFNVTNADTKKFLQGYLDKFSKWVEKHSEK